MIETLRSLKKTFAEGWVNLSALPTLEVETSALLQLLSAMPQSVKYNELPEPFRSGMAGFAARHGSADEELAYRWLMASAMERWYTDNTERTSSKLRSSRPAIVRARESARILETLRIEGDYRWTLDSDVFVKDLQSWTGKLVPCGAQVAEPGMGLPKRPVVRDGLSTALAVARCGGFLNWVCIHTHTPTLADFNEVGWDECYRCIAELMATDPTMRGMYGSSWFYDPALAELSPRLDYLRCRPVERGAHLVRVGASETSRRDALSTSATRRGAYEAGTYEPMHYMIVWPRQSLMEWAGLV